MNSTEVASSFLRKAKRNLLTTLRNGRLSMREQGKFKDVLTTEMISPRFCISPEYKVSLEYKGRVYHISLYQQQNEEWVKIPLKKRKDKFQTLRDDAHIPDCLFDIKHSLRYAVVAIAGQACLYQTIPVLSHDDRPEHEVAISFLSIDSQGNTKKEQVLRDELQLLGINSNKRTMCLQYLVNNATIDKLIPKAVRHLIGAEPTAPLLTSKGKPSTALLTETFLELNKKQQHVADPWKMKTAIEVAGPPGTGKTKTITELTRALLANTKFDIIVLSERNGAIDAIAEKYAKDCLSRQNFGSKFEVSDKDLWEKILTFGSPSMGTSTKLFTISAKIE
jgi:AAA domain